MSDAVDCGNGPLAQWRTAKSEVLDYWRIKQSSRVARE